jgi:hypothetical protein
MPAANCHIQGRDGGDGDGKIVGQSRTTPRAWKGAEQARREGRQHSAWGGA